MIISENDRCYEIRHKASNLLKELNIDTSTAIDIRNIIRKYLQKDADIKNKSPEEQKRIIQAHVKKVIVYEKTIDINKIVDLNGGGGGNRTRVRRQSHRSLYERSSGFSFRRTASPEQDAAPAISLKFPVWRRRGLRPGSLLL